MAISKMRDLLRRKAQTSLLIYLFILNLIVSFHSLFIQKQPNNCALWKLLLQISLDLCLTFLINESFKSIFSWECG